MLAFRPENSENSNSDYQSVKTITSQQLRPSYDFILSYEGLFFYTNFKKGKSTADFSAALPKWSNFDELPITQ